MYILFILDWYLAAYKICKYSQNIHKNKTKSITLVVFVSIVYYIRYNSSKFNNTTHK